MAQVRATIKAVTVADTTINVDVEFDDGKEVRRRVLNFQNGADLTQQAVIDEIKRQGIVKAKVGLSETDIKTLINTVIIVDDKTPPPLAAAAADALAEPAKG